MCTSYGGGNYQLTDLVMDEVIKDVTGDVGAGKRVVTLGFV